MRWTPGPGCWAGFRQPRSGERSWPPGQASNGRARNRARAAVNSAAQGQRAGRWSVIRRAERVSRPTRPNSRRRRVLAVTMPAPSPSLAVQRARLWAMTWTASQAPLAANRPDGRWLRPIPYFQVPDRVLDLGMAAMVGLELEHRADPVGDEGVVVVEGEERELRTRCRPDAAHDQAHRDRILLARKRGV